MKGLHRFLPLALALLAGAAPAAAREGPYRVGVLFWHDSPNDERAYEGVVRGFRIAGIDWKPEVVRANRDRELAVATLRGWEEKGFDLIYAMGTSAALRAKEVVTRTPVVFTAVTNPIGNLEVPWEGSGSNLCGNSNWIPVKRVLEVFGDAVPGLARLGVVYDRENPVSIEEVAEAKRFFLEEPKKRLALLEEWVDGPVGAPKGLKEAVASVIERGAQAIWVPIDEVVYRNLDLVAEVATKHGIPIVSSQRSAADTYAVVGVAVDYRTLGMRSVVLAAKVLRGGADPGSLPVGRMSSFQIIVNLQAARLSGHRLPLAFLASADIVRDPAREYR